MSESYQLPREKHYNGVLMSKSKMRNRFRGFLPVVVDIETSGIDPQKNALLEMCVILLDMNEEGRLIQNKPHFEHILPFKNAIFNPESLAINQIDPYQPLRFAVEEKVALKQLFTPIHAALKKTGCQRAVLVGHNAWFDLLFLKEAIQRAKMKSPFHAFTCFDTATLAGVIYGQTVLAKAAKVAGIPFEKDEAHSAIYDAKITAQLFCEMVNRLQ